MKFDTNLRACKHLWNSPQYHVILYLCHMTPDHTWLWALWVDHLRCQGNLPNHPTKSIPWICKGLYIGIWNEEERLLNLIIFIMTWASITYKYSNHKRYNIELPKYIPHHALWTHKPDKRNLFSCPPALTWWCHDMETFQCYWPFVRGIHWSPVDSLTKGQ